MQHIGHIYFNSFLHATQIVATGKLFRLLASIFLVLENVKKGGLRKDALNVNGDSEMAISLPTIHIKTPFPLVAKGHLSI
ncbi:hypothetical protein FQP34_23185 [Peribacillus simplex]|uniref:Uncharacterized protein n=1 Tax=Peribacillus simplex TaxID=1478 RepID=A0A8B5XRJ6_9BACI|nr:hypothetical protein FQP34_23185 [Peribacillus simplex]